MVIEKPVSFAYTALCWRRADTACRRLPRHRTTEHACPACGAKDAGYTYVGGERDIRKAEVWGTGAGSEGVQIQLECRECRHAWVKDVD